MLIELTTIIIYLVSGTVVGRLMGIKGWITPAFGYVLGICLFITVGLIQIVTPLPTWPLLTMALVLLLPLVLWRIFFRKQALDLDVRIVLIAIVPIILLVYFFRNINLVTWSTDSYGYMASTILIADNEYELNAMNTITKRSLGAPLAHAPAQLNNEFYLQSFAPILSISVLLILSWFICIGFNVKQMKDKWIVYGGILLGVLLLVTNHRYLFNSFYINGHLLLSAQLLIITACGWLLAENKLGITKKEIILLQSAIIPAAVVTRPEATLVILLALLPTLLLDKIHWKLRALPLVAVGVSTLMWQGYIAVQYSNRGKDLPIEVLGFIIAALGTIAGIWILKTGLLKGKSTLILVGVEISLWLTLIVFSLLNPVIASKSLHSVYHNVVVGEGLWGLSLVILGYFALVAILLVRDKTLRSLRFPLTVFAPLMLIIAFLIDGAYRVGAGDSFNRMLLHILPLLVLYIIVATISILLSQQLSKSRQRSS